MNLEEKQNAKIRNAFDLIEAEIEDMATDTGVFTEEDQEKCLNQLKDIKRQVAVYD